MEFCYLLGQSTNLFFYKIQVNYDSQSKYFALRYKYYDKI